MDSSLFDSEEPTSNWEETHSQVDLNNALLSSTNDGGSSIEIPCNEPQRRNDVGTQTTEFLACKSCSCCSFAEYTESTKMLALPDTTRPSECAENETCSLEGRTNDNTQNEKNNVNVVPIRKLLKDMIDRFFRKVNSDPKNSETHSSITDQSISVSHKENADSTQCDSKINDNASVSRSPMLSSDVDLNSVSDTEKDFSSCTNESSSILAGRVYLGERLVTILEGSDESASNAHNQIKESFDWSARCIGRLNNLVPAQCKDKYNVTDEMSTYDNTNSVPIGDEAETKQKTSEDSKSDVDTVASESCNSFPRVEGLSRVDFSSITEETSTTHGEQETRRSIVDISTDVSVNEETRPSKRDSTDFRFGNREKSEAVSVTASFNDSAHTCCSPVRIDVDAHNERAYGDVKQKSTKRDSTPTERRRLSKKKRSLSFSDAIAADSNKSKESCNENSEKLDFKTPQSTKRIYLRKNKQSPYGSPLLSAKMKSEYIMVSPIKPVKYLKALFTDMANLSRSSTKLRTPRKVKRALKPFITVTPATPV